MEVQITSRKLITPSSPTPSHLQNLKLSSFDQHFQSFYVPVVFYYPANGENYEVNNAEKSSRMQKSLSEILTLYYPLAGRCARDDPLIECHDEGVEYFEAQVNGSLSLILGDRELEGNVQKQLAPRKFDPSNSSPLAVQFNVFECGGLAIGISMPHKIGDGFTMFTFINGWATACRIGTDKVHCPTFELSSIFPPRAASDVENFLAGRAATDKIVTKRFVFDDVAISNLKASVSSASTSDQLLKFTLTRVKVVTALIWRTLIRVAQARHGGMRPCLLTIPVNMRGKTKLPITENSFGNFISYAIAEFKPDDEREVKLYDLVSRIHNGIENTFSNYAKASSGEDLFFMVMDDRRKISEALKENKVDVCMFSCWCGFPLYGADFGWGKPISVGSGSHFVNEVIMLRDTKDANGIEAEVKLEENKMLLFQQDPDIVALTSCSYFFQKTKTNTSRL